jgi:hypothetical protein
MQDMFKFCCWSFIGLSFLLIVQPVNSQALSGNVVDKATGQPLASATITVYHQAKQFGQISNKEGKFTLSLSGEADSVKISMIGYHTAVLKALSASSTPITVHMEIYAAELEEIVVENLTAEAIIAKTAAALVLNQVTEGFESIGFYREIIKDKENYFSVAEAVFKTQFYPKKKHSKIQLIKGRAKEDVAYTPLFENYHPGGGPQRAIENSFICNVPPFLQQKQLHKFSFKRIESTVYDDRPVYVIGFDQKPNLKEALEKGTLYIDAENFFVVKLEAETSPLGMRYIKHLSGTDKIFANLLGIDFKRTYWKRNISFIINNGKSLMNYADLEFGIQYMQPKKKLDLNLVINIELLLSPDINPISNEITKDEEWKQKDLAKNLPFVFDPAFWGNTSVIEPTHKINDLIQSISDKNGTVTGTTALNDWSKLNENLFIAYSSSDSIILIPTSKSHWHDNKTAPLLYRKIKGSFSIEVKLDISKISLLKEMPDKGHQQCGIIVREAGEESENSIMVTKGTAGNSNVKLYATNTRGGNSKTVVYKSDESKFLKLVKDGTHISLLVRKEPTDDWQNLAGYEMDADEVQVGVICFAHFTGSAPKMHPDIKGTFSEIKIIQQ